MLFLRQDIHTGGFPFETKADQPNQETLLAFLESEKIAEDSDSTGYTDVEDALKELKK